MPGTLLGTPALGLVSNARPAAGRSHRLLLWSGPEGKPCYLSTDDRHGFTSRLADNIEAVQLDTAAELLEQASETLDDRDAGPEGLRRPTEGPTRALRDVLRVATSRGHLLAVSEPHRF
ncbi:hypothetical protein ACFYNZ_30010 [Streptomyces kebangsaanensis]|uniref:Uncharacterized protein n=1 Tax=Streptomyces kebangsaanensis TaxID=864058 RepID=A0ABW6L0K5_9ACTN